LKPLLFRVTGLPELPGSGIKHPKNYMVYTQQEAIGRNLLDLIIPNEMKDDVTKAILEMAETGEPIPSGELVLKHKDGSPVPVISHHAIVRVPGHAQELFCLDVGYNST
jgi:two-component system, cell cycle sensor histidine kinase and response regulator CckA